MRAGYTAVVAILAAALLGGCAATVKRTGDAAPVKVTANSTRAIVLSMSGQKDATDSKDWEPFKGVWREALQEEATAIGASFSSVEGDAKPSAKQGTLLAVDVVDFRYLSTGARVAFGIMTGNAFVNAQVTFRDLETGQVLGERHYDTSSSAWQGVFRHHQ